MEVLTLPIWKTSTCLTQPGRAGAIAHGSEVDDHGDVLVAPLRVSPDVLVDADHANAIEPARIADEYPLALGQDRVVAVCHDTASASATRATVRCWTTIASNAQASAVTDNFAPGAAAALISRRQTCPQSAHRYRRTVTSSVVGRQPSGSCASWRTTLSRARPWQPQ